MKYTYEKYIHREPKPITTAILKRVERLVTDDEDDEYLGIYQSDF